MTLPALGGSYGVGFIKMERKEFFVFLCETWDFNTAARFTLLFSKRHGKFVKSAAFPPVLTAISAACPIFLTEIRASFPAIFTAIRHLESVAQKFRI
jgi:hypothetical protein